MEYSVVHKQIVAGLLRGLVEELRDKGFLEDVPAHIFGRLQERRQQRTLVYWFMALLASLISRDLVTFRRGDAALGLLYRNVGWLFFTRPARIGMALLAAIGLAA